MHRRSSNNTFGTQVKFLQDSTFEANSDDCLCLFDFGQASDSRFVFQQHKRLTMRETETFELKIGCVNKVDVVFGAHRDHKRNWLVFCESCNMLVLKRLPNFDCFVIRTRSEKTFFQGNDAIYSVRVRVLNCESWSVFLVVDIAVAFCFEIGLNQMRSCLLISHRCYLHFFFKQKLLCLLAVFQVFDS